MVVLFNSELIAAMDLAATSVTCLKTVRATRGMRATVDQSFWTIDTSNSHIIVPIVLSLSLDESVLIVLQHLTRLIYIATAIRIVVWHRLQMIVRRLLQCSAIRFVHLVTGCLDNVMLLLAAATHLHDVPRVLHLLVVEPCKIVALIILTVVVRWRCRWRHQVALVHRSCDLVARLVLTLQHGEAFVLDLDRTELITVAAVVVVVLT